MKPVVLLTRHGAVDIGGRVASGASLVIARLAPGDGHVDGLVVDDGGYGVEEGQGFGAGEGRNGLRQASRCERTGSDDHVVPRSRWWAGHLSALDAYERVRGDAFRHRLGKTLAIDGQSAAGGCLVGVGARHDEGVQASHFCVQQANGIVLGVIRPEGIRTNQFGEVSRGVGWRGDQWTHFVQHHRCAVPCRLPGRLASSQAGANDVDGLCVHDGARHRRRRACAEVAHGTRLRLSLGGAR